MRPAPPPRRRVRALGSRRPISRTRPGRGGRDDAGAELLGAGAQRADDAVLVEAPAPVGAAVVGAAHAADLGVAALGGDALGGVDGVVVLEAPQHLRRVDFLAAVERDQVLALGPQPLQVVHPVGDGAAARRPVGEVEVPARPGGAPPRQQRGVGVEDGLVALVGDRAEDLALGLAGVGEHRQRLVGVGGDHDLVELLALAALGLDPHPVRAAARSAAPAPPAAPGRARAPRSPRRSCASRRRRSATWAGRAGCTCRGCRRTRP